MWLGYHVIELSRDWAIIWFSCRVIGLSYDLAVRWSDYHVIGLSCGLALRWLGYHVIALSCNWTIMRSSCQVMGVWGECTNMWLSLQYWLDCQVIGISCGTILVYEVIVPTGDWAYMWLNWYVIGVCGDSTCRWFWLVRWVGWLCNLGMDRTKFG